VIAKPSRLLRRTTLTTDSVISDCLFKCRSRYIASNSVSWNQPSRFSEDVVPLVKPSAGCRSPARDLRTAMPHELNALGSEVCRSGCIRAPVVGHRHGNADTLRRDGGRKEAGATAHLTYRMLRETHSHASGGRGGGWHQKLAPDGVSNWRVLRKSLTLLEPGAGVEPATY
jgi:hypothetical protein